MISLVPASVVSKLTFRESQDRLSCKWASKYFSNQSLGEFPLRRTIARSAPKPRATMTGT